MKRFVDRLLTHSRKVAFLGWLMAVWAALESRGKFVWPPDKETWLILVGVTIAWLGRSALAPSRPPDPPEPPDDPPRGSGGGFGGSGVRPL
jgi:hypothetical protein